MKKDKVYWELQRGGNDIVRLTRCSFKGFERVDLRCFWRNDDGEVLPTKKGCQVHIEDLPALLAALVKLHADAVEDGILDPADYETTTPAEGTR